MRVAQFSDTFLPVVDGVGRVVTQYARHMGDLCEACYVVTPRQEGWPEERASYELLEFSSLPLPGRPQYRIGLPAWDRSYRQRLSGLEVDIVHAHDPFIAGREALRTARQRNVPLVGTFHSKYYDDFVSIFRSKLPAQMGVKYVVNFYTKCDQVWTVSHSAAEVLRSYGFRGDIQVVPNGTDFMAADAEVITQVSTRYGLGGRPVLLYAGQMDWKKNIRRILEAAALLKQQGRDFQLVMAGRGPSAAEIQQLSSALGLDGTVIFTGHITEIKWLQAVYARADLFLFPSVYDTAGLVVSEAAAAGTPSLLVRGSSAAEPIDDGENGLLIPDSTPDMAAKISWALDHAEELEKIGTRAQETIPVPWRTVVSGVMERYAGLIQNRSLFQ